MLQWMGGSRRKVTASRKSTQKRQKQYFEQRKWKQQLQQTDVDSNNVENNTYSRQSKNNKSLDVLSLLNLSAVSKEPNSHRPQGNNEVITLRPNHQTATSPLTVQTNEVAQMSSTRIKEESSSCSLVDSACHYAQRMPFSSPVVEPETQKQKLKANWNTLNPLKMTADHDHQPSIIDILGDDSSSSNFEESSGHEAHVAFSIQGLGKVDAETPVHSPVRPGRSFLHREYTPSKQIIKAHISFKNRTSGPESLEHELDTMMRDIDMPLYRSPAKPSFCFRNTNDLFSSQKLNLLPSKKFYQDPDYDTLGDMFEDDHLFGEDRRKNFWNASSSFLPSGIVDQEEYGVYCNELDQMESSTIHYADRDHDDQDFSFESHRWKKSASMISPLDINDSDSPALFPKSQATQYFEDPSIRNIKCSNYSMGTRERCFSDCKTQTEYYCSASDDTKEHFRLPRDSRLSENNRSRHSINHKKTTETEFTQRNLFGKRRFCSDRNDLKNLDDSPNFSTLKNHGFSQDIYNPDEEILMGSNHYTEDPFAAPPKHHLYFNNQPASRIVFSNLTSRSNMSNAFQSSRRECNIQSGYFDLSEASNISSSESKKLVDLSYLEDQCSDTTKPRCTTPDVTETTTNNNASKPVLEHAEETSSCAEVPVDVQETHGSGDINKCTI